MKQITFNNKQYQIPQGWGEVTVDMLIKSSELADLLPNAPIVAIISAYTGIPTNELKSTLANEVNDLMTNMEFLSNPYEPCPQTTFTLDGIEYSCNDELVNQNFEDWISIQTVIHNNSKDEVKGLPKMLAILCKRNNETLDDFDLDERAELMLKLPMTDAKNVEAFFLHSLRAYKSVSLLYLTTKEQEKLVLTKVQELENTLKQSKEQNGTSWLMRLAIGIYLRYLKYLRKGLEKSFNSKPINQ